MNFDKIEETYIGNMPTFLTFFLYMVKKYNNLLNDLEISNLYHYTNLDGFLGIINSHGFWASHIKFMNDSNEYLHGLKQVEYVFEEFQKDSSLNLEQIQFLINVKNFLNNSNSNLFVVSFCPDGDLLSQWRGYGGGQYGISIGFNKLDFHKLTNNLDEDNKPIPLKVIYNEENQKAIITEILKIGLDLVRIRPTDLVKNVAKLLEYFIPLFKDPSFSEENEWRIVLSNSDKTKFHYNTTKFRRRNNIILPYEEITTKQNEKGEKSNLSIERIIVGPSDSSEFLLQSVEYFLKEKHYNSVEIIPSKIPYR
jgi:hypothetical protein